jgi:hypothetical protein
MTWKIQDPSRLPKDMALAYCFPFEQVQTAYTTHATKDRSNDEIVKLCDAFEVFHRYRLQTEMVTWCDDQIAPGWRFRPGKQQQTSPCVLLHSFFETYFSSVGQQANSDPSMHKIDELGANFLLATALVHELAHGLNQYPEPKCIDPSGLFFEAYANQEEANELKNITPPECGLSWERSIFNKQVIGFVKFVAGRGEDKWAYQRIDDLVIPDVRNLYSSGQTGTSKFITGAKNPGGKVKKYETTSAFEGYEKTLVPWK